MARERAKFNIPMVIACVLLCLTLLSVHFTSDIYAKYVSKAGGKDSSKVASFGKLTLVESGDFSNPDKTAIIIPGVNLTKNAVVSFTASEVAVYIIAEVELSDQWETADNRTFVVKNGEKVQLQWSVESDWIFIEKDGNRYAYYQHLDPNNALLNEPIIASGGEIIVSEYITRKEIGDLDNISVNLAAYAVQAGGTDFSALDAWKKVK